MKNLAVKHEPEAPITLDGTVVRCDARRCTVRTERGDPSARRAVSCLVAPVVDDRVLVAALDGGECFVLAVLERAEGAAATITHDGDLSIRLPDGKYAVTAQKGVAITTAEGVSVVSGSVDVRTVAASVGFRRLSVAGELAQAEIDKVKLFAKTFDSVLERASQRVKRSYRMVEELDQLRAHAVDYAAKTLMRLHGKNTVMTSEEVVKVDANQIHVG